MTNLQNKLRYYLGTGLKFKRIVRVDDEDQQPIKVLNGLYRDTNTWLVDLWERKYNLEYCQPIMYRLDAITRPIKVEGYNDGKEFIPLIELSYMIGYQDKKRKIEKIGSEEYCVIGDGEYSFLYYYPTQSFILKHYCAQSTDIRHVPHQFQLFESMASWHISFPFDQSLFETGKILDKEIQ